jgi:hypothetical protein
MRLQKIVVSIDIKTLLAENTKKKEENEEKKLRILEENGRILESGDGKNIQNIKSMKNIERIFEVRYLDNKNKVIEKFKLFKYKTEDLFIASTGLKLKIPQSKSSSVNFNLLSFGNFIMFQAKSEQPITTSRIDDNDA